MKLPFTFFHLTRREEHMEHFLDKEGVALGDIDNSRKQCRGCFVTKDMGDNSRYGALRQWRERQRLTQVLTVKRIEEGAKGRPHRSSYVGTIGCQQNHGGHLCLSRQVMEELETRVIGRVKVIYQEDDRTVCCEVDEEGGSRLEQCSMFLLWIARTQSFEVGNGILVERTLVFGQIAVKRFDRGLIGQLSFLLVGSTGEGDHPRCGCSLQ